MSNVRQPSKDARLVLWAFALNDWIDPGDRSPREIIGVICGRCGQPFEHRRPQGSGAKPKYCLRCVRYPKPKGRP